MDISTEVGVVHDIRLQELRLYTDYGRCCRPLFIVEQQAIKVGWRMADAQCSGLGWAAIRPVLLIIDHWPVDPAIHCAPGAFPCRPNAGEEGRHHQPGQS